MARYERHDVKLPLQETSGICERIARDIPDKLEDMLVRTEKTNEEYAIGIYWDNGTPMVTSTEEGISKLMSKSVTAKSIRNIRSEAMEMAGLDDVNEFYDRYKDFLIVHTHPGGDPSPSGKDISYALECAKDVSQIKSSRIHVGSRMAQPTGLLAVSRGENGDIIISGLTATHEQVRDGEIKYLQERASVFAFSKMPDVMYTEEEREYTHSKKTEMAYDVLIRYLTEGTEYQDPKLNRCHAVITAGK